MDKNTPKAPNQPPTGRFMDLKGPDGEMATEQPAVDTPQSAAPVDEAPQSEQAPITVTDSDAPQSETPDILVETSQSADASPEVASEQTVPVVPSDPAQTAPTAEFPEQPAESVTSETTAPVSDHAQADQHLQHHKTSGVPMAAVLVAIIVTLALSGLVIFTFNKSKNDTNLGETTSTNSKTTITKPQASPADVDQATSDIDTSLSSLDEAADFSATEISDQSLGL